MPFDPLAERGIPLERQLRTWSELNVEPYHAEGVHPYTRCRVILMNGTETEAAMFSHQFNRHTADLKLKQDLALVRRIEQQQQKAVNWLIPAQENAIEVTIGYEQVAVDLTAWLARHEPDPYLKQVYDFGLLEDFDHLYRYANLLDLMGNRRTAEQITGPYTEIMPGRPTIFEHRDPRDDLRRPMTVQAADRQSMLNALTLVASEQQTMNYYMNFGNRPEDPLARALYLEIAQIEEQHVSHYESCLDPEMSWLTNWVLHEYHECWLYWSCLETETDARIRALWELHLNMELEHLRIAGRALYEIEGVEARSLFPHPIAKPMTFEDNKAYVRDVLARQVDLNAFDSEFVGVDELPAQHRYFAYQAAVNSGGAPSEDVVARRRAAKGEEYRVQSEGEHPIPALQEKGPHENLGYWQSVKAEGAVAPEPVRELAAQL